MKVSSNLREIIYTQMDGMAIQMDVIDSLNENIHNIAKSINKGRQINKKIESLLKDKYSNNESKKRVA